MEKLDLGVQSSLAKCFGTMVSIAGALVVTLYKGLPITSASSPNSQLNDALLSEQSTWVLGGILLALASLCLSTLFIVQVKTYSDIQLSPIAFLAGITSQKSNSIVFFFFKYISRLILSENILKSWW